MVSWLQRSKHRRLVSAGTLGSAGAQEQRFGGVGEKDRIYKATGHIKFHHNHITPAYPFPGTCFKNIIQH